MQKFGSIFQEGNIIFQFCLTLVKLRHFEKAIQFEKKNLPLALTFTQWSQNKWDIFQIFEAFSDNLNFK